MKTIVCIDDKFGVLFDGKRQSRDRVLIEDLMDFIGSSRLIITPESAPLFDVFKVEINDAPFDVAQADDFVFCEGPLFPQAGKCSSQEVTQASRLQGTTGLSLPGRSGCQSV